MNRQNKECLSIPILTFIFLRQLEFPKRKISCLSANENTVYDLVNAHHR